RKVSTSGRIRGGRDWGRIIRGYGVVALVLRRVGLQEMKIGGGESTGGTPVPHPPARRRCHTRRNTGEVVAPHRPLTPLRSSNTPTPAGARLEMIPSTPTAGRTWATPSPRR